MTSAQYPTSPESSTTNRTLTAAEHLQLASVHLEKRAAKLTGRKARKLLGVAVFLDQIAMLLDERAA